MQQNITILRSLTGQEEEKKANIHIIQQKMGKRYELIIHKREVNMVNKQKKKSSLVMIKIQIKV